MDTCVCKRSFNILVIGEHYNNEDIITERLIICFHGHPFLYLETPFHKSFYKTFNEFTRFQKDLKGGCDKGSPPGTGSKYCGHICGPNRDRRDLRSLKQSHTSTYPSCQLGPSSHLHDKAVSLRITAALR